MLVFVGLAVMGGAYWLFYYIVFEKFLFGFSADECIML